MTTPSPNIHPDLTLEEIQSLLPGARRALFRHYHLGGCSSCAFSPKETLAQLAARSNVDPAQMMAHLLAADQADQAILLDPAELQQWRSQNRPHLLCDIRSREEFEAVHIPGAQFLTQDLVQALMAGDKTLPIVFCDHRGQHALDTAAFFQGHGFTSIRVLRGGIDAWAEQIDPQLPRYHLER
ncbi:MAG: rhodanese-like domain-containing protein [Verrucomicrobiia bacterium]